MLELACRNAPEHPTITWAVQPGNHDALRFYHRLGATLRNTIIATWPAAPQSDSLHLANVTAAEPEQGNHRDQDGCHLTPR